MNHLNSVLLEGNLENDPDLTASPDVDPVCTFDMASVRFSKMNGELRKGISVLSVHTTGKLAEACAERLSIGRGVRVVGRIEQDAETGFCIVAEHVEFK